MILFLTQSNNNRMDFPEQDINEIDYPGHGMLWTTRLSFEVTERKSIILRTLPQHNLFYEKSVELINDSPSVELCHKACPGIPKHFSFT